jgi:hypothetical protein
MIDDYMPYKSWSYERMVLSCFNAVFTGECGSKDTVLWAKQRDDAATTTASAASLDFDTPLATIRADKLSAKKKRDVKKASVSAAAAPPPPKRAPAAPAAARAIGESSRSGTSLTASTPASSPLHSARKKSAKRIRAGDALVHSGPGKRQRRVKTIFDL